MGSEDYGWDAEDDARDGDDGDQPGHRLWDNNDNEEDVGEYNVDIDGYDGASDEEDEQPPLKRRRTDGVPEGGEGRACIDGAHLPDPEEEVLDDVLLQRMEARLLWSRANPQQRRQMDSVSLTHSTSSVFADLRV